MQSLLRWREAAARVSAAGFLGYESAAEGVMEARAHTRTCLAIVLAAGEGTRMNSSQPKVLHAVAGRSLLAHVLAAIARANVKTTAVVVAPQQDRVAAEAKRVLPAAQIFVQRERRGTADAVLAAKTALERSPDD